MGPIWASCVYMYMLAGVTLATSKNMSAAGSCTGMPVRLSPEVASGGLDLSRVPGIKGEKRTAIIPLRPIGFEAVPRRPAEPQTTVPAPAGVFGAG